MALIQYAIVATICTNGICLTERHQFPGLTLEAAQRVATTMMEAAGEGETITAEAVVDEDNTRRVAEPRVVSPGK